MRAIHEMPNDHPEVNHRFIASRLLLTIERHLGNRLVNSASLLRGIGEQSTQTKASRSPRFSNALKS
jgi:hypothetical protein